MAKTIRGLTVEISADASNFNKQMSAIRKDTKSTQAELNALQKSLKLEFDSTKFQNAQKVAQDAIDATSERAKLLKERLEFLEQNQGVNTSHYRKIQSELAQAELEAQQLKNQLDEINQIKFDNIANQVKGVGDGISKAASALTPLSAASATALTGLTALGLKTAATGAEIDDLSNRFGVSAEKIQEWQYLAMQTGVDVEIFNKSLIKARASMLDMANGTENNATKAMKSLGLSIEQFASNEEMFDGIIAALGGMEDKTLQAAYANEIFGDKIANEMLPFLNAGADEIENFKNEFASMSTLTTTQVKALAELDDTMNLLKESFKNVVLQIGSSFQPLLQKLADTLQNVLIPKLQQLAEWFNTLTIEQQEMVAKILLVVAALAPVLAIIGKVTSGIGGIISIIPKLGSALSALAANPIILIISAIVAILAILYTQCEEFRESINNLVGALMSALAPILEVVMGLLSSVMKMLMPLLDTLGQTLAVIVNLVVVALTPLFNMIDMIAKLIQPLITIALLPLQLALSALQAPLQAIGQLLNWLMPLFTLFANIIKGAFNVVLKIVNAVLGAIESAINWVIRKINSIIDGINSAVGWLVGDIGKINEVSLKIDTGNLDNIEDITMDTTPPEMPDTTQQPNPNTPGNIYDHIDTGGTSGDIYNNDYSTNNTTQNVTVVIENYAKEVDVDKLVREINIKLAEAL